MMRKEYESLRERLLESKTLLVVLLVATALASANTVICLVRDPTYSFTWSFTGGEQVRFINGWSTTIPDSWQAKTKIDKQTNDFAISTLTFTGNRGERYLVDVEPRAVSRNTLIARERQTNDDTLPMPHYVTSYQGQRVDISYRTGKTGTESYLSLWPNRGGTIRIHASNDTTLTGMIDKKAPPASIANYLIERISVHEVDLE